MAKPINEAWYKFTGGLFHVCKDDHPETQKKPICLLECVSHVGIATLERLSGQDNALEHNGWTKLDSNIQKKQVLVAMCSLIFQTIDFLHAVIGQR